MASAECWETCTGYGHLPYATHSTKRSLPAAPQLSTVTARAVTALSPQYNTVPVLFPPRVMVHKRAKASQGLHGRRLTRSCHGTGWKEETQLWAACSQHSTAPCLQPPVPFCPFFACVTLTLPGVLWSWSLLSDFANIALAFIMHKMCVKAQQ